MTETGAPTADGMFMTRSELAKVLGLSLSTLDALRRAGDLPTPHIEKGRVLRWSRPVIERWIADARPAQRAARKGQI